MRRRGGAGKKEKWKVADAVGANETGCLPGRIVKYEILWEIETRGKIQG